MTVKGETIRVVGAPPAFKCPRCGAVSHHPADVAEGYCGACHDWTGDRFWTWAALRDHVLELVDELDRLEPIDRRREFEALHAWLHERAAGRA